ncbi:hypothetical protein [Shimia sagamensis]|uniref:Uncharacterized protein n=1 Tax=Shimia sagamensis TaxID=1566352 RepID=A0ABY1P2Z5_9RHOB|nr:hypothetical protein [Shimia sagamensis]SMP23879.1 hypothetical protein SAMN06265373_104457 [Shimia sagamensis]
MTNFARISAVAAFFLSALPALASDDASDTLLQLIRDNGCQMTAVEAVEILPRYGLMPAQTRDIIRDWDKKKWLADHSIAGVKLSKDGCKG